MKRDIYIKLQQWKNAAADRKPLILKGARQVGKTYILKFFGQQEYENTVYLNFEEDPGLHSFFKNRLNPRPIIERLSIYLETKILPEKTLLIFDEIQNCPEALNSLKYFKEEAPDIHLAAAGSLLGIKVGKPTPFPVGKVTFMDMYPLTFFEFLDSLDRSKLRQFLENKNDFTPIETALHDQLIELLRSYYFIGGMPEVINQYIQTKDFAKVRNVQNDIITAYANDFAKHSSKSEAVKISRVWQTLSAQLAKENKKFQFSEISDRARSREYADAVQWLCDGGLVHKCYNIKVPKLPLSAYREENIFKLYLLDIGLLSAWLKLTPKTMIQGNRLFSEYNGVFVENYTAQELMARNIHELHYWTSSSTAEVDFILPFEEQILPLEVKAGLSKKKKSLKVYADKFKPPFLIRISLMNFKQDDHICNYPLYGLGLFSAGLPSYEKKDRADHFTPSAG